MLAWTRSNHSFSDWNVPYHGHMWRDKIPAKCAEIPDIRFRWETNGDAVKLDAYRSRLAKMSIPVVQFHLRIPESGLFMTSGIIEEWLRKNVHVRSLLQEPRFLDLGYLGEI